MNCVVSLTIHVQGIRNLSVSDSERICMCICLEVSEGSKVGWGTRDDVLWDVGSSGGFHQYGAAPNMITVIISTCIKRGD